MAPIVTHGVGEFVDRFPDTDGDKDIFVMAAGVLRAPPETPRHVMIIWQNGTIPGIPSSNGGAPTGVYQMLQLEFNTSTGRYFLQDPCVKPRSKISIDNSTMWKLGSFNLDQREAIAELATEIEYEPKSKVNGCRVWLRDLLTAMVNKGFIDANQLGLIQDRVPLPRRVPELEDE